ncbi:MAG: TetR/AcrR family transcriptional regulator [Elusimicrobiota bacterium]
MPRIPTTVKGRKSRDILLDKAAQAFVRRGFHATSIAHVLREAEMAGGSFYQYFRDKEDVFRALTERMREGFLRTLGDERAPAVVCERLFDFFEAYGPEYQAFRETEFMSVEGSCRAFYTEAMSRLQELLSIDEPTAWAFFGAQSMVAVRFGIWRRRRVSAATRSAFTTIALHGIARTPTERWKDLSLPHPWTEMADPSPTTKGERTRHAIVGAARELFAKKGYALTHVSHIAAAAGTAQGTFYVHFRSKREVLACIVEEYRRRLLDGALQVTTGVTDRLERERCAAIYFLDFARSVHGLYRIVREAEFAEPEIGRGHYLWIAKANSVRLREAMDKGQLRRTEPEVMACFLMGILVYAGMRWALWGENKIPAETIRRTLRFEMNGLLGR